MKQMALETSKYALPYEPNYNKRLEEWLSQHGHELVTMPEAPSITPEQIGRKPERSH